MSAEMAVYQPVLHSLGPWVLKGALKMGRLVVIDRE
jgi:hypothetical protein